MLLPFCLPVSELRLKEAIAMALGGMIGGGIYSAFGIVVAIAGEAAWFAFILAGIVAMCAGYSYVQLNDLTSDRGGAPTYLHDTVANSTLSGMTGWSLLFGYVGSIALYAYAFAKFFGELAGRLHIAGFAVSKFVAVLLIAAFVGLNLLGAAETGRAEDVLTFFKVLVIAVFGFWGMWFAYSGGTLTLGVSQLASTKPIMAAAMSFVAFQGWQLLMYDQDQFANPSKDVRRAIYFSIPAAVVLYVAVAFATVSLLPLSVIATSPEVSLLWAGIKYMGPIGAFIIGLSALFSTASAVNATLFSGAQFSAHLIDYGLLPERFGGHGEGEVPSKLVAVLGVLSAAFAVYGSLSSITSFASLAFIAVFGGMSYLAVRERNEIDGLLTPIPVIGAVGSLAFFPLLLYNLYRTNPGTFSLVVAIAGLVVAVELLYFEGDPLEHLVPSWGELP